MTPIFSETPMSFLFLFGLAVLDPAGSKEDLDLMTPANTCRSSKSRRRLFKKYTRKERWDMARDMVGLRDI